MRFRLLLTMCFLAPVFISGARAQAVDSPATVEISYAIGADLSFLKQAEESGVVLKDNGARDPARHERLRQIHARPHAVSRRDAPYRLRAYACVVM